MQIVPVIPVGAATRIQAPVLKAIAPLTKRISTVLSKSKSVFKKYPKVTKQINHAEKAIKKIGQKYHLTFPKIEHKNNKEKVDK